MYTWFLVLGFCLVVILLSVIFNIRSKQDTSILPEYFGLLLGRAFPLEWVFIYTTMLWFGISVVFGVILPWGLDSYSFKWVEQTYGMLLTLDYTITVPILVGVYAYFIRSSLVFFRSSVLSSLGLKKKKTKPMPKKMVLLFVRLSLVLMTLLIMYQASSEIGNDKLPNPWSQSDTSELTLAGTLYYTLRGINAYMALGLIAFSIIVCSALGLVVYAEDPKKLYTNELEVREEVQRLGFSISLCALLGPIVTGLHGTALVLEAKSGGPKSPLDLLWSSTWFFWVLFTFIATAFLICSIYRLRQWLHEGINALISLAYRSIDSSVFGEKCNGSCINMLGEIDLDKQVGFWDAKAKVDSAFSRVRIFPLPNTGYISVVLSIVVQIVSVTCGLISAYK